MYETPKEFDPYHLIKYLSNQANILCTPDDKSNEFKAGMSVILASVKNYFDPTWDKDLNGWIDVKNPPPVFKEVLVCTSKDNIHGQYIATSYFRDNTFGGNSHGTSWYGMDFHEKVTHWQPLPQLPEE